MLFGTKNAPATFQRAIEVIDTTVKRQFALVFIDCIIIFLKTPEDHLSQIESSLRLTNNAEKTIKLKIVSLFCSAIDYMGRIVARGKLQVATNATVSIKDLQLSATVYVLRPFLELCKYYRQFVPCFAMLGSPWNKNKKRKNIWSFS